MEADFAAAFIQQQKRRTGMAPAIGLEMVEQPFQAVLDSFGRGELMVKDLYDATEWSKRWVWPFELYAPIFEAAQRLGAPLVALNPATEVRRKLPVEGLRALTTEERGLYLPDPVGFAATLRDPNFRGYAELVVMPSYDTHVAGQFLGTSDEKVATPQNFLSARVFRDEAMASAAWRFLNRHPRRGMLLIVGGDHVRYDFGIPARLRRLGSGERRYQISGPEAVRLRAAPQADAPLQGYLAPLEVFTADPEGSALRLKEGRGYLVPEPGAALPCSELAGRKLRVASVLMNPTLSEGLVEEGTRPVWHLPAADNRGPALADYIWAEV
ncbi:unnamed protein product [Effrenium voratum]|nr:unnamed protein product [Effrenium voratum]